MRDITVFLLLLVVHGLSRVFYRIDMQFIGEVPEKPWSQLRLVAFLNHTSLFEVLYAGGVPLSFLYRLARHGVLPIAKKTSDRRLVGRFFNLIAKHVISITRARDESWDAVLRRIDPEAMVVIAPEGRMKRANGLDAQGRPMTVRGGIAEILDSIGEGRMLLAYSGGLHHVQIPGQRPRLFKTIRMNLEVVDLGRYCRDIRATISTGDTAEPGGGEEGFKRAVIADLERRRDLYCPPPEPGAPTPPVSPGSPDGPAPAGPAPTPN